ncbi:MULTISPECIES: response regulator transcription factor [Variovorax]|jgi:DNA-binding NarL/FixJ family response regulator|uniref:response regulator transcription factor n=1 Tax=Variovorax TaxID=34072 RepID=UPI00086DEB66|nr:MULTISPECIES: response regulator transcription factor [Variovorax]MBN8758061.1 response regulator transcription factor [Variovorax sp.]ODU12335.1 MAG: DNA-binding response regulator [Variovorax sp. SCN 67-85]ODV23195.1 MAG: DNA-binding response regulator [Variovorax sp. SCN 67-20]OJZ07855.1 MAG: DNA-binding response regulator [Variovorax sp. 67-131]UKI10769.1 response regulator transcription factor [Variovorax paradoxus]
MSRVPAEEAEPVSLSPTLIVEDDPAMQERLRYVLSTLGCDENSIAVTDSVAGAKQLLGANDYGVVLVDIGLPDASGVELIGWLRACRPGLPAVVISAWRTEEVIFAALRAGAIGYLLKERDDIELGIALRSIQQGGAPIDPSIARHILGWLATQQVPADAPPGAAEDTTPAALTRREHKILELVSQGLSNRDMAESLSISRLTVECHTKNIYRKLAVNSRTEAVFQARRHGLLR